jgi:hypothetical protein
MFHLVLGSYPVWPESNPNRIWFFKLEPEINPILVLELEPEPQFLQKNNRGKNGLEVGVNG